MKSILAFYMGYSESFNGYNYKNKNVFGSEINTIKLAESLTDLYDIYIFVHNLNSNEEIIYNNVNYLNNDKIKNFKNIDILVIVRYINFFIYNKIKANKIFIWVCDTIINPYYQGLILHNNGNNLLYNIKEKINSIICLSDWHLNNLQQVYDLDLFKHTIISNPLDTTYYKDNIPIIKNRFIYMSDPNRGLEILLDCLLFIQKFIYISLVVFRKNEFTDEIQKKIKLLSNVTIYGKESQETIANECLQSEYFFYPTNFPETFCNCAAEAQLYKTVCIYNNIGGLNTTIDDRGLQINYDLNDPNYINKTCYDVINLMNNEEKKEDFKFRGYMWAKNLDINILKKKWIKLFK
jgi:glycosyltransferase involved in cell wall biosynthesis